MGFKKRETETDLLNERRIIDNLVIDYFDGRKFRKWKDYGLTQMNGRSSKIRYFRYPFANCVSPML